MTQVELAALEERCLRCRDARIARCFRVSPAYMTRLRRDYPGSYAEMEHIWFTEGHTRLAKIQQDEARREIARDRRLRECLRMNLSQHRRDGGTEAWFGSPDAGEQPPLPAEESPLPVMERFGKCLLEFFSADLFGWTALLAAAAFFAGGILYPGGWTGAWMDWTGVNPMNRHFTSSPAALDFFDAPRLISAGKSFVGARLVDRDGDLCTPSFQGIGYTKRQALLDLRDDIALLPPSFERADSLKILTAALAELPDEPEPKWQKEVHAMAQAAYRPGNRAERRRKR